MSNAAAFDEQAGMLMEGCEFGDPRAASMRDRARAAATPTLLSGPSNALTSWEASRTSSQK